MRQNTTDTDPDLHKMMTFIARMNPHISLSDIAFLMDLPYELEPGEYDALSPSSDIDMRRMPRNRLTRADHST